MFVSRLPELLEQWSWRLMLGVPFLIGTCLRVAALVTHGSSMTKFVTIEGMVMTGLVLGGSLDCLGRRVASIKAGVRHGLLPWVDHFIDKFAAATALLAFHSCVSLWVELCQPAQGLGLAHLAGAVDVGLAFSRLVYVAIKDAHLTLLAPGTNSTDQPQAAPGPAVVDEPQGHGNQGVTAPFVQIVDNAVCILLLLRQAVLSNQGGVVQAMVNGQAPPAAGASMNPYVPEDDLDNVVDPCAEEQYEEDHDIDPEGEEPVEDDSEDIHLDDANDEFPRMPVHLY